MTRKEAARQLGIPEGSVASRLARARAMLAERLGRRGFVFPGGSVAAVSSAASASALAPPDLVASTIKAVSLAAAGRAAGVVTAEVAALTDGVVKAMSVTKIESVLAVMLVAGLALGGVGLGVGLSRNPAAAARAETPKEAPVENDGPASPVATTKDGKGKDKLRVLIDQVLEAHGGEDRLGKLQFTMTVKHSNGETQHYSVQPPKNLRWETTHPDRTGTRVVILFPEGRRWWNKEPNAAAKEFRLTGIEPKIEYWQDSVKFFGPRQVLRLKDADHKVALLDEEAKVGERAAVGVEVTGPHFKGRMYFDRETHLLVKRTADSYYRSQGFVVYSDYETFDGVLVARKETDGYYEPEVTDFKAVEKLDAKLFEQP